MNYIEFLENSYRVQKDILDCQSRLEYLADSIFNFTTYDSEKGELFARKAIEVCTAINDRKTFDYIEDDVNYTWFLLMCNMPFFANKLEWGTSIRGAWWGAMPGKQFEIYSCGLWMGDEQITEPLRFGKEEWINFVASIIEFANTEA